MNPRYVCPRCGESSAIDVVPFLDDDGRAKIRLTCDLIVHDEPVVQEFDDPTVPTSAGLTPVDGLVHELDLYTKLEDVVRGLERRTEYGVVEHLFAAAYPDDFLKLWRRYGHVATHGCKRYTVSAYLSRLLGTLSRHGVVAHHSCTGTGRWKYNSDVSAWSNPQCDEGPLLTWVEFADAHGWNHEQWPTLGTIPTDGCLRRSILDAAPLRSAVDLPATHQEDTSLS